MECTRRQRNGLGEGRGRPKGTEREGPRSDAAFTLVEIMLVLLILAILLAIAIPTFLGTTNSADNRAAQANLNTALITVKAASSQSNQNYTGVYSNLPLNEPSIKWVSAVAVTTQGTVSVYVSASGDGIVIATYSKNSGTCWYAADNIPAIPSSDTGVGTPYGASPVGAGDASHVPTNPGTFFSSSSGTCNPSAAPIGAQLSAGGGWAASFTGIS